MPKSGVSISPQLAELTTFKEAAEAYSVSTRTLRQWVQDRRIKAYRPYPGSRCVRLSIRELNELMGVA